MHIGLVMGTLIIYKGEHKTKPGDNVSYKNFAVTTVILVHNVHTSTHLIA
jgi:hypothetical protein